MILKAKHNFFLYPFFKLYAVWKIKRNFNTIEIIGEYKEKKLPMVLIANHVSWWDGFWAEYINQKRFKRKFHFMMLEEQLRKFWFFRHTGGFSIKKQSRSALETIRYALELLSDNKNLVLLFPQGEIQSMHQHVFTFENGLERILTKKENPVQFIFLVTMVDYFSNPRPSLYCYLQEYLGEDFSIETIQNTYNAFYKLCIEKQIMFEK